MSLTVTAEEFELFRALIAKECGITVGQDKIYLIETRLGKLAVENGCDSFFTFYQKANQTPSLKEKVIDAMTTNETLWFRDGAPYKALKKEIFPYLMTQLKSGTKTQIRIWSAACSSGQEPYSIAMTALEYARKTGCLDAISKRISIFATDISKSTLLLAKEGRYDPVSISRGLPDDLKDRYFINKGRFHLIKPEVKAMVNFRELNLINTFAHLGKFDIIMLRNVAIYFSSETKTELLKRLANCLTPDGVLFLGASESMLGYSDEFERIVKEGCTYYTLKTPRPV